MFQTGCYGARNLNISDSKLKPMKYNDTFTFSAGYKIFSYGQIIVQSDWSPIFSYTAVDTALIATNFSYLSQPNATDAFI
jgi:hypothetical protein